MPGVRPAPSRSARRPVFGPLVGLSLALALGFWASAAPLEAQLSSTPSANGERTRVFLDCQSRDCDSNHFRTEITFVDWVRDRTDADLHVIMTSDGVGGGGRRYTLDFIGRADMEGLEDQLTYTSRGTDVRTRTLDGITRTFQLGLVRYVVEAGQGDLLEVLWQGGERGAHEVGREGQEAREEEATGDPWNAWTFRFGLSGNLDLQERRSERRLNPSFGGDRVTDDWKFNFSLWANLRRQRIELADGREVRNDQDSWRMGGLAVRSVTPHISVGVDGRARNAISSNQRTRVEFRPAVEWNYYPYAEANRRQFITHYGIGVEYSDYYERTIFGVTSESLPHHRFAFQYRAREEWGNAGLGFESFQYLHDRGLHSLGLSGDVSYRISRGLEVNLSGNASRVNDQVHIAASNFSDEDILLGRVNLPTGYRYRGSVGFNYRFGSSLANVVNNRF
ncbi:MAG: hypothetical protein EA352_02125, partial [Gemmatimonadales bacterium]